METLLDALARLSPASALVVFVIENALIVAAAIAGGTVLARHAGHRGASRSDRFEAVLVIGATGANAAITWTGWWLWRHDLIGLSPAVTIRAAAELAVLVLVMDLGLYLGHRVAHAPTLYPFAHRLHHRFVEPRPATLFALHPLEVAGFGALWLGALIVHEFPVVVVVAYAGVNVVFGTLGHLGIDPLPPRWRRARIFRWVATPSFHDAHHRRPDTNLGFYTTIWDRIGRTIDPLYDTSRASTG